MKTFNYDNSKASIMPLGETSDGFYSRRPYQKFPRLDYTPEQYIEEMALDVDLSRYKLQKKQYLIRNEKAMQVIELQLEESREFYKGRYLLQILLASQVKYQRAFQYEIKDWCITDYCQFFVRLDEQEPVKCKLLMVDLQTENQFQEIYLKDPAPQFSWDFERPVKILGLRNDGFSTKVTFETGDNQIILSKILNKNNQLQLEKNSTISLILNENGIVDIYNNGLLQESTEQQFSDIDFNLDKQVYGIERQTNVIFQFNQSNGSVKIEQTQRQAGQNWTVQQYLHETSGTSFSYTFTLDKICIYYLNILTLIDITNGQLIKQIVSEKEIERVIARDLVFFVFLKTQEVEQQSADNGYFLHLIKEDQRTGEIKLSPVTDIPGRLIQFYQDHTFSVIISGNKGNLKATLLLPKMNMQCDDITAAFQEFEVGNFKILDYNYKNVDETNKLLVHDLKLKRLVMLRFNFDNKLIESIVYPFKDDEKSLQLTQEIVRVIEIEESNILSFWNNYSEYQIMTLNKSTFEVSQTNKIRDLSSYQFYENLVFYYDEISLVYMNTKSFVDLKYQKFLLDRESCLDSNIQFSAGKMSYRKRQDIYRIIPCPLYNHIHPFGKNINFHFLYAYKKIENKIICLYPLNKLLTFNSYTGQLIQKKVIDDRILTSNANFELGMLSKINDQNMVRVVRDVKYGDFSMKNQDLAEEYKDMKLYKVLEIENEDRVKIILCFLFPLIYNNDNFMKFSDDYEKLVLKDTLYEKISTYYENIYTYKEVSKTIKLSPDQRNISDDLRYYAYLEMDSIQIRDLLSNQLFRQIQVLEGLSRVEWRGNTYLALIDSNNLEKVIDIYNKQENNIIQIKNISTSEFDRQITQEHGNEKFYVKQRYMRQIASLQDKCKQMLSLQSQDNFQIKMDSVMIQFNYTVHASFLKYRAQEVIEHSFSHYHWNIVKDYENSQNNIFELSNYDLQVLLLTILPDGSTFLHKIANNNQALDEIYN
ncbi:UNKNOWN [Stylonychia lemnae]|uniref:Uncharacterized protein n=1 Tax=Stylonychia lemnae TaxID=5949 RepID=A0A078AH04_STYLE|nr:UNKNOWN [Stylonychia lemnae]|eukprot:CDW81514.1 UNKNOWN [Stylonychia lemnae]